MILRPPMQKIDTWYKNGWLTRAFNKAMYYPTNPTRDLIFSNIWAPTKVWENDRSTGPTETWIWKNFKSRVLALIWHSCFLLEAFK